MRDTTNGGENMKKKRHYNENRIIWNDKERSICKMME